MAKFNQCQTNLSGEVITRLMREADFTGLRLAPEEKGL